MKWVAGLTLALALAGTHPARAVEGLITVASAHSAKVTMDRLEEALKAGNATVFARVDHAAGAAAAGLPLRPTELLIFGNPKGGTPIIQAQQTAAIDLPMKAIAYEDAAGKVWLSYNDPNWIAARHGADASVAKVTDAMAAALKGATAKAVAP